MVPEEPWPFILPLPKEPAEQYRVLLTAFSSEIALKLLGRMRLRGRTYQRELLEALGEHSTKSVLKYLRMLSDAGLVEEGMEKQRVDGRTVWVKWYSPTFLGRWLILLLTPREELSPRQIMEVVKELLGFYAKSVAKLCLEYGLNPEYFKQLFDEAFSKRLRESGEGGGDVL